MAPSIDDSVLGVPPQLADAGNHVRSVSNLLGAELNQLGLKIAAIAATWDGPTAEKFAPFMAQWKMAAHALWGDEGAPMPLPGQPVPDGVDHPHQLEMGLLPFIGHALDRLYENYMNAEYGNTQTWQLN
jgi:hypothetical protein